MIRGAMGAKKKEEAATSAEDAPQMFVAEYQIKGSDVVVRPGDAVMIRPAEGPKALPYIAQVEGFEWQPAAKRGRKRSSGGKMGDSEMSRQVLVRLRWYYRPEEVLGGRKNFHGNREVFLSDHHDMQGADTIDGKVVVHSFKTYARLPEVSDDEYFTRFEYRAKTGEYVPDQVAVYCKCELPYNPDTLMVKCDICKDWYHPECLGLTAKLVKQMPTFVCNSCQQKTSSISSSDGGVTSVSAHAPSKQTKDCGAFCVERDNIVRHSQALNTCSPIKFEAGAVVLYTGACTHRYSEQASGKKRRK